MDVRIAIPGFDGSQELIGPPAGGPLGSFEHPGTLTLPATGVEMSIELDFPDNVYQVADQWGYAEFTFRTYPAIDSPIMEGMLVLAQTGPIYRTDWPNDAQPQPPFTMVIPVVPTQPFVRVYTILRGGEINWGHVKAEFVIHVIDVAVYNHLKKTEKTLLKQVEACDGLMAECDASRAEAGEKKTELELARNLYDNLMSAEINLYEALNPPA